LLELRAIHERLGLLPFQAVEFKLPTLDLQALDLLRLLVALDGHAPPSTRRKREHSEQR